MTVSRDLTPALCAQISCLLEATARKPGNVHRGRDFDSMTYVDFLLSAAAMAQAFSLPERTVGERILDAIRATHQVVRTNTNLGIVLLLGPLVQACGGPDLRTSVARVLAETTVEDSRAVYEAIRLAQPGGLGVAPEQDVRTEPTLPLREVMKLAVDRDLVAAQYANDFEEVFAEGVPALEHFLDETGTIEGAIIGCHLQLMACHSDSLIARKRGLDEAREARDRARKLLEEGWPGKSSGLEALDSWLLAEGHARNPGTTADLVTASLFVALWQGRMALFLRYPWEQGRTND